METALLLMLALTLGAGVCGGTLVSWSLARRAYKLECRVQDLEDRTITLGAREKATKRWDKQRAIDDELRQFGGVPPTKREERYANDPLPLS